MTVRVIEAYTVAVNTTTFVTAALFEADPSGATAAAVAYASNGDSVKAASTNLAGISRAAAGNAGALANGTLQTGKPPSTLATRVSASAIAALKAAGLTQSAAQINETSLALEGAGTSGPVSVSSASGVASGSLQAAGIAADSSTPREMLSNGSTSAALFALATAAGVYLIWRRHEIAKRAASKKIPLKQLQLQPSPRLAPKSPKTLASGDKHELVLSPLRLSPTSGDRAASPKARATSPSDQTASPKLRASSPKLQASSGERAGSPRLRAVGGGGGGGGERIASPKLRAAGDVKASSPLRATISSRDMPFIVENPIAKNGSKSARVL
jgi:hypothetical protein